MADFEPPSFSLGLDLGFDSEPQTSLKEPLSCKQAQPCLTTSNLSTIGEFEGKEDFETHSIRDSDSQVCDPPRTLKRLRRGSTAELSSTAAQKNEPIQVWCDVDDEIEDFSSQEDRPNGKGKLSAMQHQSVCSSSKFPLHAHEVLTKHSASQEKAKIKKTVSNASNFVNMETNGNKLMFPKLTASPLRRFQLIDSDSDDTCVSEDKNKEVNNSDSSLKEKQSNCSRHTTSREQSTKAFVSTSQAEDLWKDFYSKKSFPVPTPALDEFCEEYFSSVKGNNEDENDNKAAYTNINAKRNDGQQWDLGGPLPPAHRYFFHDDSRIQKLVRSRLPNFFPLGSVSDRGHMQSGASAIDYMNQFNYGESSKQAAGKNKSGISSARSRKNSKKSSIEETSHDSGSWVNPKHCDKIPKDAGKRRVQAVGQSAGRWYTAPDGRRVYVTKNGQELNGQIAYRHYRKERGGFKRSKKKSAAKKK